MRFNHHETEIKRFRQFISLMQNMQMNADALVGIGGRLVNERAAAEDAADGLRGFVFEWKQDRLWWDVFGFYFEAAMIVVEKMEQNLGDWSAETLDPAIAMLDHMLKNDFR